MPHTAIIKLEVSTNSAGGHFSRWDGSTQATVDVYGVPITIPTDGDNFTKLANRDDDTSDVTQDSPWHQTVAFDGDGVYIFDLADWGDPGWCVVQLDIDGVTRFKGAGNTDNYDSWTEKYYGPKTRKTDDREIAIDLS